MWLPLLSVVALGGTLQVPEDHPTIATAVLLASPGDTIEVSTDYQRDTELWVLIDKALTIRGVGGRPQLPPLQVLGAPLHLKEVEIGGSALAEEIYGYAVQVVHPGSLTSLDVHLVGPGAYGIMGSGAELVLQSFVAVGAGATTPAIALEAGSLTLSDGWIEGGASGAVVATGASVTVERTTFQGNSWSAGADIAMLLGNQPNHLVVYDSHFEDSSASEAGGAVYVEGGEVHLEGCAFSGTSASGAGGAVSLHQAATTVQSSTFTGTTAASGGAIDQTGGWLGVKQSQFDGARSSGPGGAIRVGDGGQLLLSGVGVVGPTPGRVGSDAQGGAIALEPGTSLQGAGLEIRDTAADEGAALYAVQATAHLEDVVIEGTWGASHGAIASYDSELHLQRATLAGNTAEGTSALYASGGSVQIDGALFQDNSGWDGAVVTEGAALDVRWARFCGNLHHSSTVRVDVQGQEEVARIVQSTFLLNDHNDEGAALVLRGSDGQAAVRNVTVVASEGVGVHHDGDLSLDLRNTLLAWLPVGLQSTSGVKLTLPYNLWYENGVDLQGLTADLPLEGAVYADPQLLGDPSVDGCATDLSLAPGSPARDAGDPNMLDPDGTRSDIGAWQGGWNGAEPEEPPPEEAPAPEDGPLERPEAVPTWLLGGGGCATRSGAPAWAWLLALALVARRTPHRQSVKDGRHPR